MWLPCTGSLIPNILMPDDAGFDAAYGTVAHDVTQRWLKDKRPPMEMLGRLVVIETDVDFHLIRIDEEMFGYVEQAVNRSGPTPGHQLIEVRVDFSHLTPIPNQGGTLDFAAMTPGHAFVDDHKYGSSPENIVHAEENTQLMLYAIGLMHAWDWEYKFKKFTLRINQPILNHFDEWTCTRSHLLDFAEYVADRAREAWQPDAPRTPGLKQCRFCKVRATCVANASFQHELLEGVFHDETVQTAEQMRSFVTRLDDPELAIKAAVPNVMTTSQLAKLMKFKPVADKFWQAVSTELYKRASRREVIPDMKLVNGRSNRDWKSKGEAEMILSEAGLRPDQIHPIEMISPAQAEELLKEAGLKPKKIEELLQGVIRKPPGRATLVPESDPRPVYQDVSLDGVFVDETVNPLIR